MTDRVDDTTEAEGTASEPTKREGHLAPERRKRTEVLERGTLVGRYVVLEVLGEGGMGIVYSAFDPELDRKVAIKLMQAKPGGSGSQSEQAWLLREAQALAKLAHPNVVGVHDVGTLPGDRVFVAMELVDGLTLRKWWKAEPRTWREILPVLRAAGAGLAAAHAAGLVHRDFKPDNVLVGNDGRVRVMDFGLARMRPGGASDTGPVPRPSDLQIEARSPLSESLTIAGSVVGTPAYMAPEIYAGEPADAATDQFAFGVTMFEALFGARPFVKEELTPPRSVPPKPKLPDKTKVPARIQRVVLRALSLEPAQRYPSMDALLAELAIDLAATRRRLAIGGGLIAAAGAAFAVSFVLQDAGPKPCEGIEERLAGVWDAQIKSKVRAGYLATKRPAAADVYARVERALDKHTEQWLATSIDSCKATRVRREQTEDVLSLRQTCLDQRLEELRSLSTVLVDPDAALVDKGDKVVAELEPLAACSDVALLRAPGLPPPELQPEIDAIYKHLSDARANMIARKSLPAMIASQKALDRARKSGFEPVIAEALLVRGATLATAGNPQGSLDVLMEALDVGLRARRDDVVAPAALSTAMWVADAQGKPGEAKVWVKLADAFLHRLGQNPMLAQRLDTVRGVVAAHSGDHATAVAAHERAYQAAVRAFGADAPETWTDELLLATTLVRALAYARAVKHFEHAIALREKAVGPDHLDIALMLSNVGIAYRHTGQGAKAKAAFERTLAIREKLFGANNPILVAPLINYADYYNHDGKPELALPVIEKAKRLAASLPGIEHPTYHEAATTYCEVLGNLGRVAEARTAFDELLALETRTKSNVLGVTLTARARLELAQRAWRVAIEVAERAVAHFEAAGGSDNPELHGPLAIIGEAYLGLGDVAAARPPLDRALAIAANADMGDFELAPLRALHARLPAE